MPKADRDTLIATAPDDIARWTVALNDWRLANYRPLQGTGPIVPHLSWRRIKLAAMIPVPAARVKNTRNAAGFTERRYRGPHRRLTIRDL